VHHPIAQCPYTFASFEFLVMITCFSYFATTQHPCRLFASTAAPERTSPVSTRTPRAPATKRMKASTPHRLESGFSRVNHCFFPVKRMFVALPKRSIQIDAVKRGKLLHSLGPIGFTALHVLPRTFAMLLSVRCTLQGQMDD
jgi:hypothetical protein